GTREVCWMSSSRSTGRIRGERDRSDPRAAACRLDGGVLGGGPSAFFYLVLTASSSFLPAKRLQHPVSSKSSTGDAGTLRLVGRLTAPPGLADHCASPWHTWPHS